MKRDSLAFALSGTLFGLLVGWIIGSQQGGRAVLAPGAATPAAAAPGGATATTPAFDAARATELERQAAARSSDSAVRTELGNLYFDAERYDQSISWYEAALALNPRDVNVSTDLAVAYYYTRQVDRALQQLDRSLALDAQHLKTILNQGIIRAFGKQDLAGAAEAWQRVVAIAPASEEGRRAQQGLDGLRSAHASSTGAGSAPGGSAP